MGWLWATSDDINKLRGDLRLGRDYLADLIRRRTDKIIHLLEKSMATQTELAQELVNVKNVVVKATGEITSKITALEAALANAGATTPEVDSALADLKTVVTALDDLNPDAVP